MNGHTDHSAFTPNLLTYILMCMKKIFTAVAAIMFAVPAMYATITVTDKDGKPVENGAQIILNKTQMIDNDQLQGSMPGCYMLETDFDVKSDKAPITIVSTSNSGDFSFCADISCLPPQQKGDHWEINDKIENDSFNLQLHFNHMTDEAIPEKDTMTVVMTDGNNSVFQLVYGYDMSDSAVNAVLDDAALAYGDNTLNYTLVAPARLNVVNMAGATVLSANLEGNGTVDLSNLPAGVYVCTLGGKALKVVVR